MALLLLVICVTMFAFFSATIYTVSVQVGEVNNAQTSLYIQLFGEKGETSKIMLRPAGPSLSKFEAGRTYKFTVETVEIGKVCKIFSINISCH